MKKKSKSSKRQHSKKQSCICCGTSPYLWSIGSQKYCPKCSVTTSHLRNTLKTAEKRIVELESRLALDKEVGIEELLSFKRQKMKGGLN